MKKIISAVLALTLLLALAGCGPTPDATAETTVATMEADQEEMQCFTGTLEDKKDFMITVTGEDGNAYVFSLDGIAVPADVGQKVTVTYTGDLSDFDAQLIAWKVEAN